MKTVNRCTIVYGVHKRDFMKKRKKVHVHRSGIISGTKYKKGILFHVQQTKYTFSVVVYILVLILNFYKL